jgi:predicted permease
MIDGLRQDLVFGWRQLRRSPFFTIIASLSVGAGVIVAVSAFTLLNAALFKPLPVRDAQQIYHVFTSDYDGRSGSEAYGSSSFPDYQDFARSGAFASLAASSWAQVAASVGTAPPAEAYVSFVSDNYFSTLGLPLQQGAGFRPGSPLEIVITYAYWQRGFNREAVIGQSVKLNGVPLTIVGVVPQAFRGVGFGPPIIGWARAAARATVMRDPAALTYRGNRGSTVFGRLRAGETQASATARLNALARALAEQEPDAWLDANREPRLVSVLGHRETRLPPRNAGGLMLMIGAGSLAVVFVLLLACTNVAALLLGRAVARESEVAVRLTMGASRGRLIRQFLTESMLLAAIGSAVSFIGLLWTIRFLRLVPLADMFDLRVDWRVVGAALITSLFCAVVFGLAPAYQNLRADLRLRMAGTSTVRRNRLRGVLIALQVAIAGVLLILALSTVRGLRTYLRSDPGIDVDGLITLQIDTRLYAADTAARNAFVNQVHELVAGFPGVISSAGTVLMPYGGTFTGSTLKFPDGRQEDVEFNIVGPAFFSTVGVRPLLGRVFDERDHRSSAPVAVVNRAFVRQYGADLLGRLVTVDENAGIQIVGVVPEIQYHDARRLPEPLIYLVDQQRPSQSSTRRMLLRVAPGTERSTAAAMRRDLRARFPDLIIPIVEPVRAYMFRYTTPQRVAGRVALAVGAVELALACVGLYGLLLFALVARRREIGVRLALGASAGEASWAVMRDGLRYAALGLIGAIALGVPAAFIAQQALPGARITDPVPFAVSLLAVSVGAALAAYLPARRAATVQPAAALRSD